MRNWSDFGRPLVIASIVAVAVVGNYVIPSAFVDGGPAEIEPYVAVFATGALVAEACLLAIWAALGRQAISYRLLCPCAILLLATCAFFAGIRSSVGPATSRQPPLQVAMILIIAASLMFVSLQIPLWVLRIRYGRRIDVMTRPQATDNAPVQFSLRYLMILTAVVAVGMVAARTALAGTEWEPSDGPWLMVVTMIAIFALFSTAVCVPCVRITLDEEEAAGRWGGILLLVFFIGPVSTMVAVVVVSGEGFSNSGELLLGIYCFAAGMLLTTVVVLLIMRGLGYRLVRLPASELDTAAGKTFDS
jgi:hypothetical protein